RAFEVARGDEFRHVRARETRQDHLLDLEGDDGQRILAAPQQRDLHQDREIDIGPLDAPDARLPAAQERLDETESADAVAGVVPPAHHAQTPSSRRAPRTGGRPASRILLAAVATSYGTRT